jgi:hypothetical protein
MNIARWPLAPPDFRLCVRVLGRLLKGALPCDRIAVLWALYYALRRAPALDGGLLSAAALGDARAQRGGRETAVICLIIAELARLRCAAQLRAFSIEWAVGLLASADDDVVKGALVCIEAAAPAADIDVGVLSRLLDDCQFLVRGRVAAVLLAIVQGGVARFLNVPEFFAAVRKLLDGGEDSQVVWRLLGSIVDAQDGAAAEWMRAFGILAWVEEQIAVESDDLEISELKRRIGAVFGEPG